MRWTIAWFPSGIGAAFAAFAAFGAPSAELLDLAARVHYGYYQADRRTIEAAMTALDRLAESPEVLYYRDFAALRLAQLGSKDRPSTERLEACAQRDVPAVLEKRRAAEAWVLVAACAQLAGDDGRRDEGLSRAREHDDDNPRLPLVEAWALEAEPGGDATRGAVATKLTAAVDAFDTWAPSLDDPDWGHAEALTALGAAALERGQLRTARDLIERALLLVPDYRAAVEVRLAMQGAGSSERTL